MCVYVCLLGVCVYVYVCVCMCVCVCVFAGCVYVCVCVFAGCIAPQDCRNVILIFSVRESGRFQGTHTAIPTVSDTHTVLLYVHVYIYYNGVVR